MHAVLINRRAYPDGADALVESLQAAGAGPTWRDREGHFVALQIEPSLQPRQPRLPLFGRGWFAEERLDETRWRWSEGDAELWLHNGSVEPHEVLLDFELKGTGVREVHLESPGWRTHFALGHKEVRKVDGLRVLLQPGTNRIRVYSPQPPINPPGDDDRDLAFRIIDLRIHPVETLDDR